MTYFIQLLHCTGLGPVTMDAFVQGSEWLALCCRHGPCRLVANSVIIKTSNKPFMQCLLGTAWFACKHM